MIRANFVTNSASQKSDKLIVAGLIYALHAEYHMDPEKKDAFYFYCLETETGRKEFIDWAKERHGLTLKFFSVRHKDEWLACGYDLEEDEALTMYTLKK